MQVEHGTPTDSSQDGVVMKFSANDKLLWSRVISGSGNDFLNSVSSTSDGGCFVTGSSNSHDDDFVSMPTTVNPSDITAFTLYLDSSGRLKWINRIDNYHAVSGLSVHASSSDECVAAGFTQASFRSQSKMSNGNQDAVIARHSRRDRSSRHVYIGGFGWDAGCALTTTTTGNIIVVGSTDSLQDRNQDMMVAMIDSKMRVVWKRSFGGMLADRALAITRVDAGKYVIAGYTYGTGSYSVDTMNIFTGFSTPLRDAALLQINDSGDVVWARTIRGWYDDISIGVAPTSDGGVIVVGNTTSEDLSSLSPTRRLQDVFAARYDSSGTQVWLKTLSGSGTDYAAAIARKNDHSFLITGSTTSTDGDYRHNRIEGTDAFLIRIDEQGKIIRR
jgi:hypothetical protein